MQRKQGCSLSFGAILRVVNANNEGVEWRRDPVKHLIEKVSYLKGMAEGMNLENRNEEGRLLVEMLDLLDELVVELERSHDRQEELHDYVDAIDEDLMDVESMIFDDDDWLDDAEEDEDRDVHRSDTQDKGSEQSYYI